MFTFECPKCVVCGRTNVFTFPDRLKPIVNRTLMTGSQGVEHPDGWFGDDTFHTMMTGIHPECEKAISSANFKLF